MSEHPRPSLSLLDRLLDRAPTPAPIGDVAAWRARHDEASAGLEGPIERAVLGGFAADRLGYAFASGYREALRQLVPEVGEALCALCATEQGSAHPRAVRTRLCAAAGGLRLDGEEPRSDATPTPDPRAAAGGLRLDGEKGFVTLGAEAEALLVVCSLGEDGGRSRLAVVRVPAGRAGIALQPLPPLPFVPEIGHAQVRFDGVAVDPAERLDGDGYERYLKPFRTVEDIHVHGALCGYLLQLARRGGWPREIVERLLLLTAGAVTLAAAPPSSPACHLALGALIDGVRGLVAEVEPLWQGLEPETRARFARDRPLLSVAEKARAARREAAWALQRPPGT